MAVLVFRGDCGGAQNHHRAEEAQHHRHSEQPAITFESSWHASSSSPGTRARRLPLQLMHQILEDAAAVFVAIKLVEAGARRREEHDVPGTRSLRSNLYRALDRSRALDRHASGDLLFNFLRSRAD